MDRKFLWILAVVAFGFLTAGQTLAFDICGNGVCCTWCTPPENAQNCHADCYCPFAPEPDEAEPSSTSLSTDETEPAAEPESEPEAAADPDAG